MEMKTGTKVITGMQSATLQDAINYQRHQIPTNAFLSVIKSNVVPTKEKLIGLMEN